MTDFITISGLQVNCHIGVPDEERATPQRLLVDLRLYPETQFNELNDQIEKTIDYAQVTTEVRKWAAEKPLKLIETLAENLANHLLKSHSLKAVDVEVRKFILPECRYVSVTLHRENGG